MDWKNCISAQRIGIKSGKEPNRSDFQRDYDRLIFSSPFRRLQNKTQVFPLPGSVFVHNRLTHSLEVASVGRSLGSIVGIQIANKYKNELPKELYEFYQYELPFVISSACIAHDIGNPAFGHAGEEAIATYFKENGSHLIGDRPLQEHFTKVEWTDFIHFEGNANAMRVLTQDLLGRMPGGFHITCTTLASIAKYPCESIARDKSNLHTKKFGFFQNEKNIFQQIASQTSMIMDSQNPLSYKRHPFVFLVEAADDICYRIVDWEDAHRLGIISSEEAEDVMLGLLETSPFDFDTRKHLNTRLDHISDSNERIAYLRAKCINFMIQSSAKAFMDYEQHLLEGSLHKSLLDLIGEDVNRVLDKIDQVSFEKIYKAESVIKLEIAGNHILSGLLELFIPAILKENKTSNEKNLLRLIPKQYLQLKEKDNAYLRTLCILDFISGMTDNYAVDLYRKIKGISISLS